MDLTVHEIVNVYQSNRIFTDAEMIHIKGNLYNLFPQCCVYRPEQLGVAKWLYQLGTKGDEGGRTCDKIDINVDNECAFRCACRNGNLEIAKWLYQLGTEGVGTNKKININILNDDAFRSACVRGHLEVAKWLYQLSIESMDTNKKINVSAENDEAFKWSCHSGHLETAKWLCTLNDNYIIDHCIIKFKCRDNSDLL